MPHIPRVDYRVAVGSGDQYLDVTDSILTLNVSPNRVIDVRVFGSPPKWLAQAPYRWVQVIDARGWEYWGAVREPLQVQYKHDIKEMEAGTPHRIDEQYNLRGYDGPSRPQWSLRNARQTTHPLDKQRRTVLR